MGLIDRLFNKKPEHMTSIEWYNQGVIYWNKKKFKQAILSFSHCLQTKSIKDPAAYAISLCQNRMGIEISIPDEFMEHPEEVACVHQAVNLVCYLLQEGHSAKLVTRGGVAEASARIMESEYLFQISELAGIFNGYAWRYKGSKQIPIMDLEKNPRPTNSDKYVISLLEKLSDLPMAPVPSGGLPTDTKVPIGNCPECDKTLKVIRSNLRPIINISCDCGWQGNIKTSKDEKKVKRTEQHPQKKVVGSCPKCGKKFRTKESSITREMIWSCRCGWDGMIDTETGEEIEVKPMQAQETDFDPEKFAEDVYRIKKKYELIEASQFGQYMKVKDMLANGYNINIQGSKGVTPLYAAALDGHFEVVKLLLDHDANFSLIDYQGWTPLFAAAENGDVQILEAILKKDKHIDAKANNGATPLIIAAQNDRSKAVEKFIDYGADINLQNNIGVTPLFISCANGHSEVTRILLYHDADFNTRSLDSFGHTPLTVAVIGGHSTCVSYLLNKGMDPKVTSKEGKTALDYAKENYMNDIIEILENN